MNYIQYQLWQRKTRTNLRFVKHANNNIAAKCIVCPWDDSMMGTIGRKAYMVSLSPGEGVGA